MFVEVPDPVWKTSIGNWSSKSPLATRSAAAASGSETAPWSRPSSWFTRAAAPLIRPSQRSTATATDSPETGKLSTALAVSPPQSCSFSCTPMAVLSSSVVSAFKATPWAHDEITDASSGHINGAEARLRSRATEQRPRVDRPIPPLILPRSLTTERDQLPGEADRIVVGHQESGAGQRPKLRVGQQVKRLPGSLRSEEHTSELQSLRHLVCRL